MDAWGGGKWYDEREGNEEGGREDAAGGSGALPGVDEGDDGGS